MIQEFAMKITLEAIGERLRQYLNAGKIGVNELGRMTKSSGAQISNIINGKNYGIKKFIVLGEACPDLNLTWLLTGEGEMRSSTTNTEAESVPISVFSEQQAHIQKLEEERSRLLSEIKDLKLQTKSLEGAVSYQEMTIEAYKNALLVLSSSNQDLKELLNLRKNASYTGSTTKKTA